MPAAISRPTEADLTARLSKAVGEVIAHDAAHERRELEALESMAASLKRLADAFERWRSA